MSGNLARAHDAPVVPADESLPAVAERSGDHPPARPLAAFRGRQEDGYYDPPHVHDRAQFSYRTQGVALVRAGGRAMLLPPGRGVWIPAGVTHEVACRGPAAYNAFYAAADAAPRPDAVRVIEVSPLLHALVDALIDRRGADDEAGRERLIARLILEEIAAAPDVGAGGPTLPTTPRLRRVAEAIRRSPGDREDLETWVGLAGMSRRTFTRRFREETGMAFEAWRTAVRMTEASARLDTGAPLSSVAFDMGYSSTDAFARAYHRVFGRRPDAPR